MKAKRCRTHPPLEPVAEVDNEYDPAELFAEVDLKDYITLELGVAERLPLLLRYDEGMQLIHTRVIEVFGHQSVEEAIRIVHELIEVKDGAAGLGDEGDCWAGWRRDHQRHNLILAQTLNLQSAVSSVETFTTTSSSAYSLPNDALSDYDSSQSCSRQDRETPVKSRKISRPAFTRSAKSHSSSLTLKMQGLSIHRPAFLLRRKSADAVETGR